jgi:hypothetical protein
VQVERAREGRNAALSAVAIVDGQQRLRWLDVSYEPFMNLKFVAEEAERLLKQ